MIRTTLLLAIAALALTASAETQRTVVFNRRSIPRPFVHVGPAADATPLVFHVALKQENLHLLDAKFNEVSNPASPMYTKYMSVEDINAIVAPTRATVDAVTMWLNQAGATSKKLLGDVFRVRSTVGVAKELFETEFQFFMNNRTGRTVVRQVGEWSLPSALDGVVDMVTGVSDFPADHFSVSRRSRGDGSTDPDVIPATIVEQYNLGDAKVENGASQGVIEFQDATAWTKQDNEQFYTEMAVPQPGAPTIIGQFQDQPALESTLDYQYQTAVAQNGDNYYYTSDGWLYEFSVAFAQKKDVPSVFSMSYGWSEAAQCQIAGQECSQLGVQSTGYVKRVNTEFQKIGLRGVSILASSGDSGANGRTDGYCSEQQLFPVFPAASPYVTAVGATQLSNPTSDGSFNAPVCSTLTCGTGGEEVAVSYDVADFTSGGGFSNVVSRPSYQDEAVEAYLSSSDVKLPPASYFNAKGRGYPDMAALGHNFIIRANGQNQPVGGTSASSPTLSAIITLINDARIGAGKKPLGFLNPALYSAFKAAPAAFNDVVKGDNICTENGCQSSCKGFYAAKGWDPVTGLGTPNFPELKKYLLSL